MQTVLPIQASLVDDLDTSPSVYVQKFDVVRNGAYLVRLEETDYKLASFLDDRLLATHPTGQLIDLNALVSRADLLGPGYPLNFIFHSGHVGSTLVSRLLDTLPEVLCLREPVPLRQLADCYDDLVQNESLLAPQSLNKLTESFLKLWARGYPKTRHVVVKATSSASRLAQVLLSKSPNSRALCLSVSAETYIAWLLAGSGAAADLRGHAKERVRRLHIQHKIKIQTPLFALSIGQLAAIGWVVETLSHAKAVASAPDRVITINFDHLLENLGEDMSLILRHLGMAHDERSLTLIEQSPVRQRNAKAPNSEYSAATRNGTLAASRQTNRDEIRKGLALIERIVALNSKAADFLR